MSDAAGFNAAYSVANRRSERIVELEAQNKELVKALKGLLDNPVPVESWDESAEEHNKRWDRNAAAITEARVALREAGVDDARI